jgi:hypothetical protein
LNSNNQRLKKGSSSLKPAIIASIPDIAWYLKGEIVKAGYIEMRVDLLTYGTKRNKAILAFKQRGMGGINKSKVIKGSDRKIRKFHFQFQH